MIGKALKNLTVQWGLTVNSGMAYGYLQGSYVTLTEHLPCYRLSIYVGCVNVTLPEGEDLSPAAKCSSLISDMVREAAGEDNAFSLMKAHGTPAVAANHGGSVVTVNFSKDEAGLNGLQRFVVELLPRITPLTAPLQCCHCGNHTGGQGYPVRIASDTVVPMHAECLPVHAKALTKENFKPMACLGAAVGALLGAAAWAVLFHAGYISVIGACIILALTQGSYVLFKGTHGRTQAVVVGTCILAAVLLGTAAGYLWEFHEQYVGYGSIVAGMMRESVYLRVSFKNLIADQAALTELILNLVTGIVCATLGAAGSFIKSGSSATQSKPQAMPGKA